MPTFWNTKAEVLCTAARRSVVESAREFITPLAALKRIDVAVGSLKVFVVLSKLSAPLSQIIVL